MIFTFLVRSKLFRKPKNVWFSARVEIDVATKKLLFSSPRVSNEPYEEYETGEGRDEPVQVIEPDTLDLSEFKPLKIKDLQIEAPSSKKSSEACYKLEMFSSRRIGGKSLKLTCSDLSMYQEFCKQLIQFYQIGGAHNSFSQLSLVPPSLVRFNSGDSGNQLKMPPQLAASTDLIGGEYATVAGDGIILSDDKHEMVVYTSAIYESFDQECCFQVTLEQIEPPNDVSSQLQSKKGNPVYLYLGFDRLELLTRDRCLDCAWPYTQIRSFAFSDQQVQIDVGTRTTTGRVSLIFGFDVGATGMSKVLKFAKILGSTLSESPPGTGCRCCTPGATAVDDTQQAGDGVSSNPCYFSNSPDQRQNKQRQQRVCGVRRQLRLQTSEDDYYSSVHKPVERPGSNLAPPVPPPPMPNVPPRQASSGSGDGSENSSCYAVSPSLGAIAAPPPAAFAVLNEEDEINKVLSYYCSS